MRAQQLQHAIDAVHVRFGDQALVRATRLETAGPWPTGVAAVDRLSGIGGLPRGRISVLLGPCGSGRLSVALVLLAHATRDFARVAVLDHQRGFDPWTLDPLGADLATLSVVRPPTRAAAGEAAVALARAGAGFLLALEAPPEPSLAALESAAARSGCLVVVLAGLDAPGAEGQRALAHAASLTLRFEHVALVWEHGLVLGHRALVRCVKNKLALVGSWADQRAELELRYPVSPRLFVGQPVRELTAVDQPTRPAFGGAPVDHTGTPAELWRGRSAAG